MSGGNRAQRSHRELYKATTPPWKETYRQRCFERLRGNREKLQAKFRQLGGMESNTDTFIEDLMKEELEAWKQEQCVQGGSTEDYDVNQMVDTFEDIQKELRDEELRIFAEYEEYVRDMEREEENLCAALVDQLSTEDVICPMCRKNLLCTSRSTIFCACGMQIDTEQDCLTLSNIKQMLDTGLSDHGVQCESEPIFSLMSDTSANNEHTPAPVSTRNLFALSPTAGINNLLMTCPDCDWMSVVI